MRYYEDFQVGDKTELPGKAVFTLEGITAFAKSFDPQPHHLDEEAAKASVLGGLSASGWHTTCAVARLIADYQNENVAFVVSPGIDEAQWKKPVFPGDALTVSEEILEMRPSQSNPSVGLLRRLHTARKEDGTVALIMDGWLMVSHKAGGAGP